MPANRHSEGAQPPKNPLIRCLRGKKTRISAPPLTLVLRGTSARTGGIRLSIFCEGILTLHFVPLRMTWYRARAPSRQPSQLHPFGSTSSLRLSCATATEYFCEQVFLARVGRAPLRVGQSAAKNPLIHCLTGRKREQASLLEGEKRVMRISAVRCARALN